MHPTVCTQGSQRDRTANGGPLTISLQAGLAGTATISKKSVSPGATLYLDIHMMDGGSGKCEAILGDEPRAKSVSCVRGAA